MEIWKDIPDYEGYYQASNLGRIRSVNRVSRVTHNDVAVSMKEKILKPWKVMRHKNKNKLAQMQVDLSKNNKAKAYSVHRLVLLAFRGIPQKGMVGCHNDGNPANNELSNLRWDTMQANEADKKSHGTDNRAENIRGVNRWNGTRCKKGVKV